MPAKIIFTEKETKEIINDYTNKHISIKNISIKSNHSEYTISNLLESNNVKIKDYRHFYFNQEEIKDIINKYTNQNYSAREIAKFYKVSDQTISRLLVKNKCILNNNKYIKLEENISDINNKYIKDKMTANDIGKNYGVSGNCILNLLRKNKIISEYKPLYLDENYFNKIDTQNKAYMLGFIYADGCIIDLENRQKQLVINLQFPDRDILESFRKELKMERELYFIKTSEKIQTGPIQTKQDTIRLTAASDILTNDLIKLGCTPRKSLTLKFPDSKVIPPELMRHFIRGLYDGDGYVSYSFKTRNVLPVFCFGIVGTLDICLGVRKVLSESLELKKDQKLTKQVKIFDIRYNGYKNMIKIFNYLYKDAELFLKRKYDIMVKIFDYYDYNLSSIKSSN